MGFDIVRGKITKPEQSNQLIEAVQEYMDKNAATGTLYLGYPLTANADEAITVEALWVTESKGMIAFILGNSKDSIDQLKEQQDSMYYNLDFYLKKYSTLRKGRNLASPTHPPVHMHIEHMNCRIFIEQPMLRFTDMTLEEIAIAVGMNGGNYFSRMFKKIEGISPREYRKQW